jgi:hypothetical protein
MAKTEEDFAMALDGVSHMCNAKLNDFMLDLYTDAMRPHGWDRAIDALKMHILKSKQFPAVYDLLEIVAPQMVAQIEESDDAAVTAGRIWDAIGKFGDRKTGPEGDYFKSQREFIGSLGWEVVKNQWNSICSSVQLSDQTFLVREWKSQIKGIAMRARAGLPSAPELPSPGDQNQLAPSVARLIESVSKKTEMLKEETHDW